MDHIGHSAKAVERIKTVHRLRRVRHTDRHAVALADAEGVKRAGGTVNAGKKLRIGCLFAHKFIGNVFGDGTGGLLNELVHRQTRIVNGFRNLAVKIQPRRGSGDGHGLPPISVISEYYNGLFHKKEYTFFAKCQFFELSKNSDFISEEKYYRIEDVEK